MPNVDDSIGTLHLLLANAPEEIAIDVDRYNRDRRDIFGSSGKATRLDDGTISVQGRDATVLVRVVPAGPVPGLPQYTACQPEFYQDDPEASSDERLDEPGLAAACAAVRSAVVLTATLPCPARQATPLGTAARCSSTVTCQVLGRILAWRKRATLRS